MCGRYRWKLADVERAAKNLDAVINPELKRLAEAYIQQQRFNMAPMQIGPIIRRSSVGQLSADGFKWGLVPFWSKTGKADFSTFNARGETVATSNAFRDSFKTRRCLVVTSGFFEWENLEPEKKTKPKKQPWLFGLPEGAPLVMAGLWSIWRPAGGEEDESAAVRTYTIVTTTPNETMGKFHNRMPVILPPDQWLPWIDDEPSGAQELIKPYEGEIVHHRVTPQMGAVKFEDPSAVEPINSL